MADDAAPPTRTYRGNCHCGNFVYTVTVPEITKTSSCDCSVCSKKGVLWTVIPNHPEQFKVVKGDEEKDLSVYQWSSKALHHKFCKTCGSAVLVRWPTGPLEKQMLLNTRCIQDFDVWKTPTSVFPGSKIGNPYQGPEYTGPEPTAADIKDAKTYHGSCHCGDIQLAYKTEPLTESTKVTECNCSICQRNAYLWTYPKADQVVITGTPSLTTYSHGIHVFIKTFCSRCGVPIQNYARNLSSEELGKFPAEFASFYESAKTLQPVNLRLLNGFDFLAVKPEKANGWGTIEPQYVNP